MSYCKCGWEEEEEEEEEEALSTYLLPLMYVFTPLPCLFPCLYSPSYTDPSRPTSFPFPCLFPCLKEPS